MKTQPFKEKILDTAPGGPMLAALLGTMLGLPVVLGAVNAIRGQEAVGAMVVLVEVACIVALSGLFVVNPNEGRVIQLFGRYVGTAREPGLRWANPFFSKRAVSLRLRSFESAKLKVNDLDGNPIEIAAIIAWKVIDTAEACFQVDDYQAFVAVQAESAVRNLATSYSYDAHDAGKPSLRSHTETIAVELKRELDARLVTAGVEIVEARISHLAYAPEIAQAMLQRQQAGAIIAARALIVEGAVGMVEMALAKLAERQVVSLDDERKAQMVSNLLVVLCGERATQPVVNTGTLYS
ncbi:MAG: SPFH domain-containing protein [Myxococcales bacterium]|jgi:regulator of protease activity HflC (stomatin/prohibitin superfamily)|nr:SPFH domain-containing protein [Myxococcales bacterium]MBL0198152.1 SPFH domain-containing protein [Myxococcales bacterium]HQY63127.1 SPFH domain-containing protein [Polyangiaceae bacterium]